MVQILIMVGEVLREVTSEVNTVDDMHLGEGNFSEEEEEIEGITTNQRAWRQVHRGSIHQW